MVKTRRYATILLSTIGLLLVPLATAQADTTDGSGTVVTAPTPPPPPVAANGPRTWCC
jgi:hypothetical protein